MLSEAAPSKPLPFVGRGVGELEETARDERPEVGGVEGLPGEEVDGWFKVTGVFPRASGSRPTLWATVTLKLPSS